METLDAKALRIFMAVVRMGSIRSAAQYLDVAPSVVSRQVADTERTIGLPLFDRTARGVILTEAGELVFEHGKRILEDNALVAEQLDQLRGIQQGRVRICCGEGFLSDFIQNALRGFVEIYPAVRYVLQVGGTDRILDAISNGDADIGVVYDPVTNTKVRSLAIARQPLCLIAPPGHPLLSRSRVALADCLSDRFAVVNKSHGITHLVARVAADAGIAVAPLVESDSIDALIRFVTSGIGVSFLPRFVVEAELASGALGAVELSDPLLAGASAHVIVRAGRRLPLSVERLAGFMTREMAALRTHDGQ